jgi:hypothetical protein
MFRLVDKGHCLKDKPYTAEDRILRLQVSQGAESVVYIFTILAYVVERALSSWKIRIFGVNNLAGNHPKDSTNAGVAPFSTNAWAIHRSSFQLLTRNFQLHSTCPNLLQSRRLRLSHFVEHHPALF